MDLRNVNRDTFLFEAVWNKRKFLVFSKILSINIGHDSCSVTTTAMHLLFEIINSLENSNRWNL